MAARASGLRDHADLFYESLLGESSGTSFPETTSSERFFADLAGESSFALRRSSLDERSWDDPAEEQRPELVGTSMPRRPADAKSGSAFLRSIMGKTGDDREQRILRELRRGNFPNFLRRLKEVEYHADTAPDGTGRTWRFFAMPDLLAVGSDSDYVLMPMGAKTAQRVADSLGFVLPTGKIVEIIFQRANRQLRRITQDHDAFKQRLKRIHPKPFRRRGDRQMSSAAYLAHHQAIMADRALRGRRARDLVAGHKKIVVLSKYLYRPEYRGTLAFYGWYHGDPPRPTQGRAGAPTVKRRGSRGAHHVQYADYSHGVRLIGPRINGGGRWFQTVDVLKSAELAPRLSTEGRLPKPRIPDVRQ